MKATSSSPIPEEVYRISQLTQKMVMRVPQGTNLALYQGLMTLMSGALLASRGALIPALAEVGFDRRDSLRIWQGLAHGNWEANALLGELHAQIAREGRWTALRVGGYQVKALDTVGYYRPRLNGCVTTHYQSPAGKALPAICLGQLGAVGWVGQQPVTLPCALVRAAGAVRSEADLMRALAEQAAKSGLLIPAFCGLFLLALTTSHVSAANSGMNHRSVGQVPLTCRAEPYGVSHREASR